MFMLIVLCVAFLMFRGLGLFGMSFLATDLIKMVPSWFPYPRQIVSLTGICEVLGAIGLLLPFTRSAAGFCLAVMFIAIFPANIKAAVEQIPLNGKPPTPLWLRLPMQLFFIGFALWAAL